MQVNLRFLYICPPAWEKCFKIKIKKTPKTFFTGMGLQGIYGEAVSLDKIIINDNYFRYLFCFFKQHYFL